MTLRQILFLIILILTSLTYLGQEKKKIILFSECDTSKDIGLDMVGSSEVKSSDEKLTKWLVKNSDGKKLAAGSEFKFILDNKKGVCLKKLTIYDSTNVNVKDLVNLISKLADYPEFKKIAKNSSKTRLLVGLVYYDKPKNQFKIGLELLMTPY